MHLMKNNLKEGKDIAVITLGPIGVQADKAEGIAKETISLKVKKPRRWNLDTPYLYQESGNLRDDVCCRNGCGQDFLDIYVPFDRTYFRKPVWVKSWNI